MAHVESIEGGPEASGQRMAATHPPVAGESSEKVTVPEMLTPPTAEAASPTSPGMRANPMVNSTIARPAPSPLFLVAMCRLQDSVAVVAGRSRGSITKKRAADPSAGQRRSHTSGQGSRTLGGGATGARAPSGDRLRVGGVAGYALVRRVLRRNMNAAMAWRLTLEPGWKPPSP